MTKPEIEVRDLTYHYPDGNMALRDVSFAIAVGESVGVVGPNGAGKSTLLLHLNGLLPGRSLYEHQHRASRSHPHDAEPRVWVAGMAVIEDNMPEIRRRVGLLFQDPDDQLFCPTVAEDVAFGPKNLGHDKATVHDIVAGALEQVGLTGYGHRIAHHLSFGERKRVCLAGVLACSPTVLALDEPSGNLDPATRRRFIELLRRPAATKVVASHDLELVLELCDRVLLLDRGQLYADGPVREVLSDSTLLEQHGLEVPLSLSLGGYFGPSTGMR
jgi:cobalt/nickel transport system ATP-binding protein